MTRSVFLSGFIVDIQTMKKLNIIIIIILILTFEVFSFSFEPISTNYSPTGPRSNQVFRIINTENSKIAVMISVTTREYNIDGTEINFPVEDLFMIFPSRIVLEPGESRAVRVKWTGDPNPEAEIAFRIIAEQIPIEFEMAERTDGAGIRLTYKYIGNIYILPHGASPDIVIHSYELNENELVLEMLNQGSRHTLMKNLTISITGTDGEIIFSLTEEEVRFAADQNMLVGYPRRFVFPLNTDKASLLSSDGWEVDFDFDPLF